jgi:hypothetical protein
MGARGISVVVLALLGISLAGLATESQTTNVEIVLDASSSMGETVPGGMKFEVARQAIEQLLGQLPSSYNVALRVFGHRFGMDDGAASCQDTELLVAMSLLTLEHRAAISQRLAQVQPRGLTPISYVLNQAATDFPTVPGRNIIFLVSDGEETCGGDPLSEADSIAELAIGLRIYVIGFDVDSQETLEGIAEHTGGAYYDAQNATELGQVLQQAAKESTSGSTVDLTDILIIHPDLIAKVAVYSKAPNGTVFDGRWFACNSCANFVDIVLTDRTGRPVNGASITFTVKTPLVTLMYSTDDPAHRIAAQGNRYTVATWPDVVRAGDAIPVGRVVGTLRVTAPLEANGVYVWQAVDRWRTVRLPSSNVSYWSEQNPVCVAVDGSLYYVLNVDEGYGRRIVVDAYGLPPADGSVYDRAVTAGNEVRWLTDPLCKEALVMLSNTMRDCLTRFVGLSLGETGRDLFASLAGMSLGAYVGGARAVELGSLGSLARSPELYKDLLFQLASDPERWGLFVMALGLQLDAAAIDQLLSWMDATLIVPNAGSCCPDAREVQQKFDEMQVLFQSGARGIDVMIGTMMSRASWESQALSIGLSFVAGGLKGWLQETFDLTTEDYRHWANIFATYGPDFAEEFQEIANMMRLSVEYGAEAEKGLTALVAWVTKSYKIYRVIAEAATEQYESIWGKVYDAMVTAKTSPISQAAEASHDLRDALQQEQSEAPIAPEILEVTDLRASLGQVPGTIVLTWTVPESSGTGRSSRAGALGFIVKWASGFASRDASTWTSRIVPGLVISPRTTLSAGDKVTIRIDGLMPSSRYQFVVYAYDGYVESSISNVAGIVTP